MNAYIARFLHKPKTSNKFRKQPFMSNKLFSLLFVEIEVEVKIKNSTLNKFKSNKNSNSMWMASLYFNGYN